MLKLTWHIGDVVRKLRDVYGLSQSALGRPNTVSDFEKQLAGYQYKSGTLEGILDGLTSELSKRGVIARPLRPEDLLRLVPEQRQDVTSPVTVRGENLDPEAARAWDTLRTLPDGNRQIIYTMIAAFAATASSTATTAETHPSGHEHSHAPRSTSDLARVK